jgi:phage-related protein
MRLHRLGSLYRNLYIEWTDAEGALLAPLVTEGHKRLPCRCEAARRIRTLLGAIRPLEPSDWKPMSSVGVGVQEIRVRTGPEHRVFYIAKFEEGIYVLHAFEKKTRKTPKADLDLAKSRLRELLSRRRAATKI